MPKNDTTKRLYEGFSNSTTSMDNNDKFLISTGTGTETLLKSIAKSDALSNYVVSSTLDNYLTISSAQSTYQTKKLTTSISSSSTDDQYPSAKCMWDKLRTLSITHDNTGNYEKLSGISAIEITGISDTGSKSGGYIDFHYYDTNKDYTSRIIESAEGQLSLVKENHTGATVQLGNFILSSAGYGSSFPTNPVNGQVFFKI